MAKKHKQRSSLDQYKKPRTLFKARFGGYIMTTRDATTTEVALLTKLVDCESMKLIRDHVLVFDTQPFKAANLLKGMEISFLADSTLYVKGFRGKPENQRLHAPTSSKCTIQIGLTNISIESTS